MTHKLIKTDNYLLIVDDSEINIGDWATDKRLIWKQEGFFRGQNHLKIIAHLPLNNSPILQGVDLLPPFEQEDDVEKLAKEEILYNDAKREWWKQGYNKAKEKYKYTQEDMMEAMLKICEYYSDSVSSGETLDGYTRANEIIQFLSQPKMPIGFEREMEETFTDGYTEDRVRRFYSKKPKTTNNSQGQTVWVGKYIY